jgi:hypothetical protein
MCRWLFLLAVALLASSAHVIRAKGNYPAPLLPCRSEVANDLFRQPIAFPRPVHLADGLVGATSFVMDAP